MQLILLMLIMGLLLFIGVFAGVNVLLGRTNKVKDLFREPEVEKKKEDGITRKFVRRVERIFKPLGEILPRSPEEMSRQEQKLWQAGIRRKDGPVMLYGAKLGLVLGILLISSVTGHLQQHFFPMLVVAFFAGSFLPDVWLSRKVKKRKETIGLSLADAVDLTVVCVEAGLGLDQSLMRIGEEMKHSHPDLSEELSLYHLEVRTGRNRVDALRNLGKRTDVEDLNSLVTVLIQSDRFGTSIGKSLRIFADSFRTKRRQRAEERAAKMTIKMIPALIVFILPALIVVVIGPAIIAAIREVLPGLTGR